MKILLGERWKVRLEYYKDIVTVCKIKDDGAVERIDAIELNDLLAAAEAFEYLRETDRVERKCAKDERKKE